LIDLTRLGDGDAVEEIDGLCARAIEAGVAAVCVWPRFVERCSERLDGSGIAVATVVNFPRGDGDIDSAVSDSKSAIEAGASEIDLVMPYASWLGGRRDFTRDMIVAVGHVCGDAVLLKVILETGRLRTNERIRQASQDAIAAGADFIKTSTGRSRVSATPAAAGVMLEVIRAAARPVGFKAAGGIRTVRQAAAYLRLADGIMGRDWIGPRTFRFGASSLLDDCERQLGRC
jgi:deoxyribose-phosphate aldolase